jgi:hypothetical protein
MIRPTLRDLLPRRPFYSLLPILPFLLPPLLLPALLSSMPPHAEARLARDSSPQEASPIKGGVQSDRGDVPLARATLLLDYKLRAIAKTGILRDLPCPLPMAMQIDASGAIRSVTFDRPCGRAGRRLEVQLLGWRLETWTVPGTTTLRLTLETNA